MNWDFFINFSTGALVGVLGIITGKNLGFPDGYSRGYEKGYRDRGAEKMTHVKKIKNGDEVIAIAFFKDMKELEDKYQKILCSGDFDSCWDECVIIRDTLFHKTDYIDKV